MIYLILMQPCEVVLIIFPFNRGRNVSNNFPNGLQLVNCGTMIQTLLCLMLKPARSIVIYIYIYNIYIYTHTHTCIYIYPYQSRLIASANNLQISANLHKKLEAGLITVELIVLPLSLLPQEQFPFTSPQCWVWHII